jgi:hypothetical protein
VLGDRHYDTPELRENCDQADRLLVTTRYRRYPHACDGVGVRRVFPMLRSIAMENFHEHFKGNFSEGGLLNYDQAPVSYGNPTVMMSIEG